MSSRTTTVRLTRTTTKSSQENVQQETQPLPSQDRCAHCKKFLPAVKADCRFCRLVFCMEHRHPETHSPTGCAQRAREESRQQFQQDSGHIFGAEASDRGSTHRPGWNLEQSRQNLHQRLNQRVNSLKESSGRKVSSSGSGSGSTSGPGSAPKKAKASGKKTAKKPTTVTWGTGGHRLGGRPSSGPVLGGVSEGASGGGSGSGSGSTS